MIHPVAVGDRDPIDWTVTACGFLDRCERRSALYPSMLADRQGCCPKQG
jgi:hypothetical protein